VALTFEKILAVLVVAICVALLLRLAIGERRRGRVDAALRRWGIAARARARALWHWRATRRQAEREAEAAIRRARGGEWDGNVYKPDSFKKPPRNKMH